MQSVRFSVFMFVAAVLALASPIVAQSPQQPRVNGMRPADLRAHAITNATVVTAPGESIDNATIVIRDGLIVAVGSDVAVPPDARVWPGDGLTVYPGLIDPAVLVRLEHESDDVGSHWNGRVHPELNVTDFAPLPESQRKQFRDNGFTVAAVYPRDGIFRGTGAVIALGSDNDDAGIYDDRAAMMMGFDYGGGWSSATYPGSLMGSIALIRQTLLDAQWHDACRKVYQQHPDVSEPPAPADALAALQPVVERRQPVLFEVGSELNAQRAMRIAREFNLDMMLLGCGTEFRRLRETIDLGVPIIVPLKFPDRPNVTTIYEAQRASLRELATWEQAPTNPRRLVDGGAVIALTTHRLNSPGKFHGALRNAIRHGLDEDQALAALTTTPAKLLGLEQIIGTIEPGKLANLVVVDGSLFERKATIRDTWVNGRRYEISSKDDITLVGNGTLVTSLGHEFDASIDTTESSFTIRQPAPAPDADADDADAEEHANEKQKPIKARKVVVQRDQVSCIVDGKAFDVEGYIQLSGVIDGDTLKGTGRLPDATSFTFRVTVADAADDSAVAATDDSPDAETAGENVPTHPAAGMWNLTVMGENMPEPVELVLKLVAVDENTIDASVNMMGQHIDLGQGTFDAQTGLLTIDTTEGPSGPMRIVATITGSTMNGTARDAAGENTFTGSRALADASDSADDDAFEMPPDELVVPLGAFGVLDTPKPEFVLIRGATIWTCGPEGVFEGGDMLIRNGRIEYVGPAVSWAWEPEDAIIREGEPFDPTQPLRPQDIESSNAPRIINASGKHITPGLIDCHSHTGIDGGVNEWTQVNTAEVRIGDVIDPDDINWYRQLAGGLTACNQLHGSANPIGGQNSVVKLKWGGTADDFRVDDAIAGIKFALGENVKRTTSRYPNTRMGVETVFRDAFTAAREYERRLKQYLDLPSNARQRTMPPARDLELEALVEILNDERLVHCHSYRQDEILMLIRVADDFGFTIGTFQHVLEGYKVAEAIAEHGAGASSFSDWWAYKVEVMDAIPHNGSLMTNVGVNVSFNSDSSELARRMNAEAAKAVRYGGMMPHDALKFVTINPARQLRIDHRTGSLEQGKDADFVIWSGDPLSTYTRCEQTWIEGACYYDLERNAERERAAAAEHQRLVQKVLADAHGAPAGREPDAMPSDQPEPGVDTQPTAALAARFQHALDWMKQQVRDGIDPEELRPGDCGCNDLLWQLMQTEVRR